MIVNPQDEALPLDTGLKPQAAGMLQIYQGKQKKIG